MKVKQKWSRSDGYSQNCLEEGIDFWRGGEGNKNLMWGIFLVGGGDDQIFGC